MVLLSMAVDKYLSQAVQQLRVILNTAINDSKARGKSKPEDHMFNGSFSPCKINVISITEAGSCQSVS